MPVMSPWTLATSQDPLSAMGQLPMSYLLAGNMLPGMAGSAQTQGDTVQPGTGPLAPSVTMPQIDPAQNPLYASTQPGQKGATKLSTQKSGVSDSTAINQNTYMSPEEHQQLYNTVMTSPLMQDQMSQLANLKNVIGTGRGLMAATQSTDLSPLLALSDSLTGSHLLDGYTKPPTPGQVIGMDTQNAALLQGKQADLAKQTEQDIKDLKTGSIQAKQAQNMQDMLTAGYKSQANQASYVPRMLTAIGSMGAQFRSDPALKQLTLTKNSLDRAQGILDGTAPIDSQSLYTLQSDVSNALTQGGAATDAKTQGEMVKTLQSLAANINTEAGGNITDLRKENPALLQQIASKIAEIRDVYNKQGQDRIDGISAPYQNFNDPMVQDSLSKTTQYYKNFFGSGASAAPLTPPTTGPQVGEVHSANGANYKFKGGDPSQSSNWVKQ